MCSVMLSFAEEHFKIILKIFQTKNRLYEGQAYSITKNNSSEAPVFIMTGITVYVRCLMQFG